MTCVIAFEHEGKIYMGCDSAAAASWDIRISKVPKIFRVGEFAIGYTSSFRMGQLLNYHLEPRERKDKETAMEYMVSGFIPAARTCLKDGGYTLVESNRESSGNFIVVYDGDIYEVYDDFQVNSFSDNIHAVGCGGNYALASLCTQKILNLQLKPRKAIELALDVSARFSNGVSAPFTVVCVDEL